MDDNYIKQVFGDNDKLLRLLLKSIDTTDVGIVLTNPRLEDNPIVYVNKGFLDVTGYNWDECVGKNCRFLQGKDRKQIEIPLIRENIKNGKGIKTVIKNYRKNGEMFWNQLNITPIKDKDGNVEYFFGVQTDITKEIEQEEAIKKMNELLTGRELRMIELKKEIEKLKKEKAKELVEK